MSFRTIVSGVVLALAAARGLAAEARPNVLFIMVDEMKWNAMSCAGNSIVSTPHLDGLARQGTRFATAYTVAPICTPSRYSFLTGRYAHVHGSVDNGTPPGEPLILLPAVLKHAGYQTAISGKLHFIPATLDYGFDYFWSFAGEGPRKLPSWPAYLQEKYGVPSRRVNPQPFADDPLGRDLGKVSYPKEDAQTFWITDRAGDFFRQRDQAKPFFLFVSYLDPHSPSHLADPYWNMFDAEKMPLPASFRVDPSRPSKTGDNRHEVNDPQIVKAMTAAYYAKVKMVDDNIGRLLKMLQASGAADNTLIIFTADHGNMLGDLNRWFKGCMYEGSTRIPLLMKAPASSRYAGTFNRGKVVEAIVENIDVMPTLCEMVDVALPKEGIQGRSLTGLVAGKTEGWKNRAFAERSTRMVRHGQFKLVCEPRRNKGDYELYDLEKDPGEMHNLIDDPAYAKVVKDLKAELDAWQNDHPPVPVLEGVEPQPVVDASAVDKKGRKEKRERRAK